jgi:6-phosphogluconate dehydrogenase
MVSEIGYIGLGKMGKGMVERLSKKGYRVVAYDPLVQSLPAIRRNCPRVVGSLSDLFSALKRPRLIWLMVPEREVGVVLKSIMPKLSTGDTVVDGGNSFYKNSMKRASKLKRRGVNFLDAGVSGGPSGALSGACLMVGGDKNIFRKYRRLFGDLAVAHGVFYVGGPGRGHFVKMIHNGIEYGMMQAIAEGFSILKKSGFKFKLEKIAALYNRGSVIESRLIGWLEGGFRQYGDDLEAVSGSVAHSGEGQWTVKEAKKLGVAAPVIADSFRFRLESADRPSYTGKILSALRNQFGGHKVKKTGGHRWSPGK